MPSPLPAPTPPPPTPIHPAQDHGAGEQKVRLATVQREGATVDVVVASGPLAAGDAALRVPECLIVTLDRVFEDSTLAELLTTNKLSGVCL